MQNSKINTLNLHPLQELLNSEVDINALIQHLDNAYHYFSHYSMKVSCLERTPIDEEEIVCLYWIERLKQIFEEMKN